MVVYEIKHSVMVRDQWWRRKLKIIEGALKKIRVYQWQFWKNVGTTHWDRRIPVMFLDFSGFSAGISAFGRISVWRITCLSDIYHDLKKVLSLKNFKYLIFPFNRKDLKFFL
jgi:hypothetical protein